MKKLISILFSATLILLLCACSEAATLKKAEAGDVSAMEKLIEMYHYGDDDGNWDYEKAMEWAEKAAEKGSSFAYLHMAYMYLDGEGVDVDYEKAMQAYEKAAADGYPEAISDIGYMYELGLGVKQDILKAFEYYRMASEKGNETAKENYKIIERVGKYFEEAQNGDAEKQFSIGVAYFTGDTLQGYGFAQDYEQALSWYEKACSNGNAKAATEIGYMYGNGYGVEKSLSKALEYYEKGAEGGDPIGKYNLATSYYLGNGVEIDDEKAFELFKDLAENDEYEDAYCLLGECYLQGYGTEIDYVQSAKWLQKAIDSGLATSTSYSYLGQQYLNGDGVEKDNSKAREYLEKAYDMGDSSVKALLDKIA